MGAGTEPEPSGRAVNAQTTEPPLLPLGHIFSYSHVKIPRSQKPWSVTSRDQDVGRLQPGRWVLESFPLAEDNTAGRHEM